MLKYQHAIKLLFKNSSKSSFMRSYKLLPTYKQVCGGYTFNFSDVKKISE